MPKPTNSCAYEGYTEDVFGDLTALGQGAGRQGYDAANFSQVIVGEGKNPPGNVPHRPANLEWSDVWKEKFLEVEFEMAEKLDLGEFSSFPVGWEDPHGVCKDVTRGLGRSADGGEFGEFVRWNYEILGGQEKGWEGSASPDDGVGTAGQSEVGGTCGPRDDSTDGTIANAIAASDASRGASGQTSTMPGGADGGNSELVSDASMGEPEDPFAADPDYHRATGAERSSGAGGGTAHGDSSGAEASGRDVQGESGGDADKEADDVPESPKDDSNESGNEGNDSPPQGQPNTMGSPEGDGDDESPQMFGIRRLRKRAPYSTTSKVAPGLRGYGHADSDEQTGWGGDSPRAMGDGDEEGAGKGGLSRKRKAGAGQGPTYDPTRRLSELDNTDGWGGDNPRVYGAAAAAGVAKADPMAAWLFDGVIDARIGR